MLRSPPGTALLLSQGLTRSRWQLFMPVATLRQEFARRTAKLFWWRYYPTYMQAPFQLAACEAGGVPVACAIQAFAYEHYNRVPVNVFIVRKQQKKFGLLNHLEGVVHKNLPVLLVDDVVGAGRTLRVQGRRLHNDLGLPVMGAWCVIAGNPKYGQVPAIQITPTRPVPVDTLFGPDDITWRYEAYVAKYGKPPQFAGVTR